MLELNPPKVGHPPSLWKVWAETREEHRERAAATRAECLTIIVLEV